jgi:MFS transporter, AAHS family, 4-hydroxybenzoate transporter
MILLFVIGQLHLQNTTITVNTGLSDAMATYVGVSLNVGAAIGTAVMELVASKLGLKKRTFTYGNIA